MQEKKNSFQYERVCTNTRFETEVRATRKWLIVARPSKRYLYSDPPDRQLIAVSGIQINCEVVCKACFTHMLHIWTLVIIILHTIAVKVIDTHITDSLCCRENKTQHQMLIMSLLAFTCN